LGHAISQRLASGSYPQIDPSIHGDVVDVARGSAAVVFVGRRGEAMEIPDAARLRELVAPSAALRGHRPVNDVRAASPEVMSKTIGPVPDSCWHTCFCVAAVDLDISGIVHQAACISYFERMRFSAAAEGGYPPDVCQTVMHSHTQRSYVAYMGYARQGDILEAFSWVFGAGDALGAMDGVINLAFEVRKKGVDAVLLRGCLILVPSSEHTGSTSRL